jgi:BRCT domain type II-containing protein
MDQVLDVALHPPGERKARVPAKKSAERKPTTKKTASSIKLADIE